MLTKQLLVIGRIASVAYILAVFLYMSKSNLFYPALIVGSLGWMYCASELREWFSSIIFAAVTIAALYGWLYIK